jgi:hypothetical protein
VKAEPSRLQVKVDPAWVEVKPREADVLDTVPDGPEEIVVSGARLTVQVRIAGVGSVRP